MVGPVVGSHIFEMRPVATGGAWNAQPNAGCRVIGLSLKKTNFKANRAAVSRVAFGGDLRLERVMVNLHAPARASLETPVSLLAPPL